MCNCNEVLRINIRISQIKVVEGHHHKVVMIHFEGDADCENFKGSIQPGAIDTQVLQSDKLLTLSARYLLSGVDKMNNKCQIFIENNLDASRPEETGKIYTRPRIITDSKALAYLETANLSGIVNTSEKELWVSIYRHY